jgi:hypothetical protein
VVEKDVGNGQEAGGQYAECDLVVDLRRQAIEIPLSVCIADALEKTSDVTCKPAKDSGRNNIGESER